MRKAPALCCSCRPRCWDVPEEIPDWDRCWPSLLPAAFLLLISTGGALDGEEEPQREQKLCQRGGVGKRENNLPSSRRNGRNNTAQRDSCLGRAGHWCRTSLCDFPAGLAQSRTRCWWARRVPGGAATLHYPRTAPRREAAASPIASSPACPQAQARRRPAGPWKGM